MPNLSQVFYIFWNLHPGPVKRTFSQERNLKSKVVRRLIQGHSTHTGQSLNYSVVSFDLIASVLSLHSSAFCILEGEGGGEEMVSV